MVEKILSGTARFMARSDEAVRDILVLEFTIVNACMIGEAGSKSGEWVLVDTGMKDSGDFFIRQAQERFGSDSKPAAIILTHGHFDHTGSAAVLAEYWNVPVFAHELEVPYITGKKDYPPGDPTVDEGLVAKMSAKFPHEAIDLGHRAAVLPPDGNVPGLKDWKWIHTPGHTEGHISLFRDRDRVLIAGDAFTTTKQESLGAVLTQKEEIKGPPAYLTTDWVAARRSVEALNQLQPTLVIPSHGQPMKGESLKQHLALLVETFDDKTKPRQGRYI